MKKLLRLLVFTAIFAITIIALVPNALSPFPSTIPYAVTPLLSVGILSGGLALLLDGLLLATSN